MCGVSAILLADSKATTAAIDLHESLYLLQHRGQDAAGIAVCQGGRVYHYKGNGMAAKVFADGSSLQHLPGFMGLGHLRYPTMGTSSAAEAQPFYVNSPFGISIAVNGNLVNTEYLRQFVDKEALRHVNSDSDSELLLNIFAHGLQKLGKTRAVSDDIFTALGDVYSKCQGAFACTAMIAGFGILGFRDANGIRPLCIGSRPSTTVPGGKDYFMASESVALKQLGFGDITDVLPGQAILITKGGSVEVRQIVEPKSYTPDSFEFVYLARPDSTIDGISVYRSRQMMGEKLAKKIREVLGDKGIDEIDAIIPVPETSNTAAAALAQKLGKPYVTALIKNRYVHRTFILPNQAMRQKSIRRKLSPIESEFEGKNLIIVDDSLVRGTTSRQIVQMARESGAKRVVFVSSSPECTNPHIYGIDLADPADLIARGKTRQEIAEHIDADDVIFLDLEGPDGLKAACLEAADSGSQVRDFEVGVFCGRYVTDVPDGYFDQLSDLRKGKRDDNFRSTVVASDSGAAIFV
ncbi:Putative Phosphoribosyltransferase domain, glutamine amidotransferase type 2 [Colletotrichum destructivum]|uniref:Amidophosphoribosyltransferase n=2 Tax=Colletotrichum destructivum species complex TaxID=2707350 RepID=A0A4T0VJL6_9PEZI|nr:Amidophosphoribosyltransferase [Colletotrichum higginsianum]WQF88437.1 Putative Phosphoribosyltransferase domain, glutamine amidotransferase type 2 [Colletotrichum destructivum]